jgi:membrane fusion protein (multidrug efflux system)
MADDARNAAEPSPEETVASTTPEAAPGNKRKRLFLYMLVVVVVVIGVPYGWQLWQYYATHESTDDAYVAGDVVPVSAQVHGVVVSTQVRNHQRVEAGQLLVQLDQRDFAARLQQAEAAVAVATARLQQAEIEVGREEESTRSETARTGATLQAFQSALQEAKHSAEEAQARLRTLEAAVTVAQADIDTHDAHVEMARMEFERAKQLLVDGVVAQQLYDETQVTLRAAQSERHAREQKLQQAQREVERARADVRTKRQAVARARAGVDEARALLAGSQANRQNVQIKQAQVAVARALWEQREADRDYARLQLEYTTLRAPVAGVIAKENVKVGQVVQAGRPLFVIVPLHQVWVMANFKETQLRYMRPGQKATLKVDTYPGEVFHAKVDSLSPGTGSVFSLLPPENATGNFVKVVQRVPVKIVFEPLTNDLVLRPGMSVIATVKTRE